MIVFLIGYMGCGKTSLGKRLAQRLGCRLVDTDRQIEQSEGAEICDIFRYEGEEYFRRREREVLESLIGTGENLVVSTGGGAPVWRDNMALMNGAGTTVYVRRSAERIAARLSPYGRWKRPKLRGLSDQELVAFMTANMAEREPFYLQARLVVDGDALSDERIVERIGEALR